MCLLGSSASSLRYGTELSTGEQEVRAGREPRGGLGSHLVFGCCMPGGEGALCSGVPGMAVLSTLGNLCSQKLVLH